MSKKKEDSVSRAALLMEQMFKMLPRHHQDMLRADFADVLRGLHADNPNMPSDVKPGELPNFPASVREPIGMKKTS